MANPLHIYHKHRLFRTKSNIYGGAFCKNSNYFRRKASSKMFDWVLNASLIKHIQVISCFPQVFANLNYFDLKYLDAIVFKATHKK